MFEIKKEVWITDHEPDHDGTFLVACGYGNDIRLTNMNYTTDGGWNTSRYIDGRVSNKRAPWWGGYIHAWAEMPRWEEP